MNYKGRWIKIQSYKHDGRTHRFWRRSFVLEDNEEWLIVASKVTQVIEGNGRKWYTKEPAVSFFNKKDWFNVIGMVKSTGIAFYTNIASPTIIDRGIAKYIDYDLDIKRFNDNNIKFLDRNEFMQNAQTYNYGEDLIKIIDFKLRKVAQLIKDKKFPFVDEIVVEYYDRYLQEADEEEF